MTSLLTALMLTTQLNVAEAKPRAHHARPHRTHQQARPRNARPTGTHSHRTGAYCALHPNRAIVRPAQPRPPAHAHGTHHVRWHNGYWVRTHRNPAFVWRWNPRQSRWTIVIRF